MCRAPCFFRLVIACVFLTSPVLAGVPADADQDEAPNHRASQLKLQARLSIAGMQEILRKEAIASVDTDPVIDRPRREAGVGADVRSQVRPESLELIAQSNGRLDVQIPIDITVTPIMPGLTDVGVDYEGCKPTTFNVTMRLVPRFSDDGSLQFAAGRVTADNDDYPCRIYTNVAGDAYGAFKDPIGTIGGIFGGKGVKKLADVNVTQLIRKVMVSRGRAALAGRIKQVNARLPTEPALQGLLRQPAAFSSVISLGIDYPRIRMRSVQVDGDDYTLIGSLEGYPRLQFGKEWTNAADLPSAGGVSDGFRLPARLLLPTDRDLLPDANLIKASVCLGSFRLQPVAARTDLAVLQRCDASQTRNVIWLSGDSAPPPGSAHPFERPMSNFLSDAVAWLDDPKLWCGVDGIERLRAQVKAFKRVVDGFQADTTLPIQGRGSLSFSDLRIDLHRLWVTGEGILADVTLVGEAELTLDLMP